MNFKSLKVQILFWFSLTLGLILSLFGFVLYTLLEENITTKLEATLHEKALFLSTHLEQKEILQTQAFSGYDVALFEDKKMVLEKGNLNDEEIQTLFASQNPFLLKEDDEKFDIYYILNLQDRQNSTIILAQKNIPNKAEDLEEALMILIPILLVFLIFLVSKVIDQILQPLKHITAAAQTTSVTGFSTKIQAPKAYSELQNLVDAFNAMIERLKYGIATIEQFNHDVSHELKTPLTVIKGEVEVTLDRPRDKETYIKSLQTIEEEAQHIENIVNELLLLTKYSKENIKESFEFCSLDTILQKSLKSFEKIAKEKNISLHVKTLKAIILEANLLLIERIFVNLIDNAIKYTPSNKMISLSLFQDEKIHFIIEDEGVGISKEKLAFITERFYRADTSRNKTIKGYGLGLSIVKSAIELHEGILDIKSTQGVGTTVHVTL